MLLSGPVQAGLRSPNPGGSTTRVVGFGAAAEGTYRYTTLEDTRRLIAAGRPYRD